jgi:hypothetical protein
MSALALIPDQERNRFGTLPPQVKQEANEWLAAIKALDAAEDKMATADSWAAKLGVAAKTIFSKRSAFRANGWKALVNHAKAGPGWWDNHETLPAATVEHLKRLAGNNQRASAPAIRALHRQLKRWRNGDATAAIPGYDAPPPGDPPKGWSARNLARYFPSKFELDATRRGQNYAVGKRGPQTFTTRAHRWHMSDVMIDDVWHDNFVVFGKQLCRVLELDALDVFSGALMLWGTKPRLKREDGTFDTRLAGYVNMLMAGLFGSHGYAPRGTTILAEHGTAALSEAAAKILFDASNGLITVRESGITGEEQAIIGWRGQGKGNSRFKSCLEVHHSLKHNELAGLPAQTGLSRETRPEYTHGILQEDEKLLQAMSILEKVNPARASRLRTRLLDYHSAFVPVLMDIYGIINQREWHNLEGWHLIPGNIQIEYRLAPQSDQWLSNEDFLALPEVSQDAILSAATEDDRYLRRRRLSPAAVVQRERRDLLKLPDWAVADLLHLCGSDGKWARKGKVAGAYFNLIYDIDLYPEPLRYESRVQKPDGAWEQLRDGDYEVMVNHFDLSRLYVRDAAQHFLGVARRAERVDRGDADALRRDWGHQSHRLCELTAPLIKRHDADIKEETARLKHNAGVFAEQTQEETALERRLDRRARKETGTVEDLGSAPQPAPPASGVSMEELNQL